MFEGTSLAESKISTESTGNKIESVGGKVAIFFIKPDNVNIDYTVANSVRLWVINHIHDFYISTYKDNTNWKFDQTNHEGCLVKSDKTQMWDSLPGKDEGEYQLYFSTIPIDKSDVQKVCNIFGTQNKKVLKAKKGSVKRPYPDDPSSVRIKYNDIPTKLRDAKTLESYHKIKYESGKSLLISPSKMPDSVRNELLKFPGANRTFKAAIEALYKGSNLVEYIDICIIEIPVSSLVPAANLKKLTYWETMMYLDNDTPELNHYRKLQAQSIFTQKDLIDLRLLLAGIRGSYIYSYDSNRKPLMLPYPEGPPRILYDNRIDIKTSNRNHWESKFGYPFEAMKKGPFWIISESEDARIGIDKKNDKEDSLEDTAGDKILMHKLDEKFTSLPKPIPLLPSIDDEIIDHIKNETKEHLINLYGTVSETKFLELIKSVLESKYKLAEAEFISKFFCISIGDSVNLCLLNALSNVVKYMRTYVESRSEDIMREDKGESTSKVKRAIKKNLIVGFATGNDAFSESPTPKHVYTQLKEWWDNLCETEKKDVKNSYEIEVKGYSSPLGEKKQVNIELRNNRAWKIAQSLKLLLSGNLNLQLIENQESPGGVPPDPKIKTDPVKLYFCGEKKLVYPTKNLKQLYAPMGSMICDVFQDNQTVKSAVKGLPSDNDPKDRIGWVVFKKSEFIEFSQFIKETNKVNAAGAISAYRILNYTNVNKLERILLYAIPGVWDIKSFYEFLQAKNK